MRLPPPRPWRRAGLASGLARDRLPCDTPKILAVSPVRTLFKGAISH